MTVTACPQIEPQILAASGVRRGVAGTPEVPATWNLATFAGRFGEISGDRACASLTLVFRLLLEAQQQGEPAAWITLGDSTFFPPDAAAAGIDLNALPVVRVGRSQLVARAADHLLRSGAFGVVVLDLSLCPRLAVPMQMRLAGLAKKHEVALLCITEKESHRPSVGSLVSLRVEAGRTERTKSRFGCEAQALKDKRRGPGWTHKEVCRAPDGLC